jgi:hypothetical protein
MHLSAELRLRVMLHSEAFGLRAILYCKVQSLKKSLIGDSELCKSV